MGLDVDDARMSFMSFPCTCALQFILSSSNTNDLKLDCWQATSNKTFTKLRLELRHHNSDRRKH